MQPHRITVMGYNDRDGDPRSRLGEFIENFFAGFMTFSYCIGGWLVHFGMDAWWMLGLSAVIASIFALAIIKR